MNLYEIKNLDKKHILLKNVDGSTVGILHPTDIKFSPRFNSISELSFTVYKDTCPYYNQLTSYMRIEVDGLMKFIMGKPQIINDGLTEYKIISAKSFEIDINRKTIPLLNGTFKFYSIDSDEETILSIIMSYLPNWSIESVDSQLWNLYRTFDLNNVQLYNGIQNEISLAFECVFLYDTINQKIKVVAYENIPQKTDVYLSYNNLINELQLTEKTEDILTALTVFGAGENLSINLVNPTGSTIYNFNHFINQDGFMSDTLKNRILEWQDEINIQQPIYANLLTQRATKLSELIILQTELTELNSELKALEITRDALLDSGLNATSKNNEVKAKRIEIINKENEIDNKQDEVDNVDTQLQSIQNLVSLSGFFTQQELLEIEPFIIQNSITDDNFVIVDTDTELDKQETAQALYDKYKNLLDEKSKLKYEFAVDLLNFLPYEEYQAFTNQLQWGSQVTLQINDEGDLVYPMLLGLDIDWNDNIDIKYLFSTEVKLSDAMIDYDDFSNEVSNMSNKMAGDSVKWSEFTKTYRDDVNNLFKKGLEADKVEIINSSQQELVINEQGLLARRYISDNNFDDRQVKLIHNKLAFTRDNWNNLSTVLGEVHLPDNSTSFGLNAEVIMGNLIAGNQLVIKNSNNTFVVDSQGAKLTNASLTVEKGLNKILLDPTNGFKIQKKIGTTYLDMIYLDTEGNAVFKGNVTGSTISGSSFTGGSINIGNGNFTVGSDGSTTIKKGSLNIDNRFTVDTDGTVKILKGSLNINSNFVVDQLGNVSMNGILNIADKLIVDGAGNMTIYGGSISWASSDPKIATAQLTANTALSNAQNAHSLANSAFNLADDVDDELSLIKNNIGYTRIGADYVISPNIVGAEISGSVINGSVIRIPTDYSSRLQFLGGGSISSGTNGILTIAGDNGIKIEGMIWTPIEITGSSLKFNGNDVLTTADSTYAKFR